MSYIEDVGMVMKKVTTARSLIKVEYRIQLKIKQTCTFPACERQSPLYTDIIMFINVPGFLL